MSSFGFIKIVTGKSEGRIGRFIGFDDDGRKAKIAFGYETDILPYSNYRYYSINSFTDHVSKQDLIDRYFEIAHELRSIDVRGHSEIKKYSAEHTSLISECNLIRGLLREFFSVHTLKVGTKESNIVLFCSFRDTIWTNELALDLEMKGFSVAICSHELNKETPEGTLDFILKTADHYLFIDHEEMMDTVTHFEQTYLEENKETVYQTLSSIVKNKKDDDPQHGVYYFGEPFSPDYEQSLDKLTQRLEMPQQFE